MSSWKYEVKLRQLTPLIHFQAEQPQATLRATEVKPKLDRFLLWYLAPERFSGILSGKDEKKLLLEIARSKKWLLPMVQGDGSAALNYKMQISADEKDKIDLDGIGAYFSVGQDDKKMGAFSKALINLTIICFNEELLDKIKEVISMFFSVHNFGFRQNKGFGSFLVVEFGEYNQLFKREELVRKYVQMVNQNNNSQMRIYKLEYKKKMKVDFELVLKIINNFHKYIKSKLLFNYVKSKDNKIINEKEIMNALVNQKNLSKGKYKYIRGVLGFANHYTFNKKKIKFNLTAGEIKRFPSPLYFLPVYDMEYDKVKCLILVPSKLLKRLYDINPTIEMKPEISDEKVKNIPTIELPRDVFDLHEFFQYLITASAKDDNLYNLKYVNEKGGVEVNG